MTQQVRESYAALAAASEIKAKAHITESYLPILYSSFFEMNQGLSRNDGLYILHKDWALAPLEALGIPDVSNLTDVFNVYLHGKSFDNPLPHLPQFNSLSQALYSTALLANIVFNIRDGEYDDLKSLVLESSYVALQSLIGAALAVTNDDEKKTIAALNFDEAIKMAMGSALYVQANLETLYQEFGMPMANAALGELHECTLYFLSFAGNKS